MEKCVHCGAETKLHVYDRPVCSECAELIDQGKPPKKKPSLEKLKGERTAKEA